MTEPIFEITSYSPTTQQITGARLHQSASSLPAPLRWPLARLGNRNPIVLADHVGDERRGVDVGYVVAPFDPELFVPVYAARAGDVSFAVEGADGCAVSLDHGDWTTHYAHMSKMFVTRCLGRLRRRQHISAGEVIGYAAKSPLHVRFELWQRTDDRGFVAVAPRPHLEQWTVAQPENALRIAPARPTTDNEAA